jgi:hypothetical protein
MWGCELAKTALGWNPQLGSCGQGNEPKGQVLLYYQTEYILKNRLFQEHFQFFGVGWDSPLGTWPTIWPTVPAPDDRWWMWRMWRMRIGKGNTITKRKPAPVILCPPQIPHELARTRAGAVGSRRLTTRGMARPSWLQLYGCFCSPNISTHDGKNLAEKRDIMPCFSMKAATAGICIFGVRIVHECQT